MGPLRRFLDGDVIETPELALLEAEGIELHLRRLRASVAYDRYRAPGRRFHGKRSLSAGGVLVTASRVILWAGGVRQLDLMRASLPTPALGVHAQDGVLQVRFRAEDFHRDRHGRVRIRWWTAEAGHVAGLLTR